VVDAIRLAERRVRPRCPADAAGRRLVSPDQGIASRHGPAGLTIVNIPTAKKEEVQVATQRRAIELEPSGVEVDVLSGR